MSQFEFLMSFASVVLAIAVTEIFGGWGKLARSSQPIRWSGLWVGWSAVLVGLIMMYWSGMWPYRDASFSEGYRVAWLVVPTFLLVILCFLFSPEPDPVSDEIDLAARYWQIAPRAFSVLALFMISAGIADALISGQGPFGPAPPFFLQVLPPVLLLLVVACSRSSAAWLHVVTLAGFAVLVTTFLTVTTGIFE